MLPAISTEGATPSCSHLEKLSFMGGGQHSALLSYRAPGALTRGASIVSHCWKFDESRMSYHSLVWVNWLIWYQHQTALLVFSLVQR